MSSYVLVDRLQSASGQTYHYLFPLLTMGVLLLFFRRPPEQSAA
jgi:cytochrome bd-type quinol oxidase subunit 1